MSEMGLSSAPERHIWVQSQPRWALSHKGRIEVRWGRGHRAHQECADDLA